MVNYILNHHTFNSTNAFWWDVQTAINTLVGSGVGSTDPCGDRILAERLLRRNAGEGHAKTKAGPSASASPCLHPNANDKEQDHPGSPDPRAT